MASELRAVILENLVDAFVAESPPCSDASMEALKELAMEEQGKVATEQAAALSEGYQWLLEQMELNKLSCAKLTNLDTSRGAEMQEAIDKQYAAEWESAVTKHPSLRAIMEKEKPVFMKNRALDVCLELTKSPPPFKYEFPVSLKDVPEDMVQMVQKMEVSREDAFAAEAFVKAQADAARRAMPHVSFGGKLEDQPQFFVEEFIRYFKERPDHGASKESSSKAPAEKDIEVIGGKRPPAAHAAKDTEKSRTAATAKKDIEVTSGKRPPVANTSHEPQKKAKVEHEEDLILANSASLAELQISNKPNVEVSGLVIACPEKAKNVDIGKAQGKSKMLAYYWVILLDALGFIFVDCWDSQATRLSKLFNKVVPCFSDLAAGTWVNFKHLKVQRLGKQNIGYPHKLLALVFDTNFIFITSKQVCAHVCVAM